MLKENFTGLLLQYTDNELLISDFWNEIQINYTEKNRYYHTLEHLQNLLQQLEEVKHNIENWHAILFTLYYHDIIYNTLKSDNEINSAKLAIERMKQIAVSENIIVQTENQIIATQAHLLSEDMDTNYFLDADLSVLGQSWIVYENYFKNIRKEYAIYPNFLYKKGRKKMLNHFLAMERIYKTDYFYQKYEQQAKNNIQQELTLL